MKDLLKFIIKLSLAIGIIYWLIQSGKLDFSLVGKSLSNGYQLFIAFILILIQATLGSVRWKLILQIKSNKSFSTIKILKINWIGLFFNTFLPGAVTGDFIKLLYIKDMDPKISKTYLITSVLIDRILGLTGLLTLLGLSSVFFYNDIILLSPKMEKLLHFNLLLFFAAICFILVLFSPKKIQSIILNISTKIPLIGQKVSKTLNDVWLIGSQKSTLIKCLFLSIIVQSITIIAFYIVSSPFYGKNVPLSFIASLVPSGFIAIAIPISPSGLGVGHYIFDLLFSFIHIEGGASFFNLYFLIVVSVNLLGFIPYLFSGRKHSIHEAEELEEAITSKT